MSVGEYEKNPSAVQVVLGCKTLLHRRILRFAVYAKLKIEARDRTLARTGRMAVDSLEPSGGPSKSLVRPFLKEAGSKFNKFIT